MESTAPVSRVLYRHCCRCLSFIYYARHHASLAFYPPSHPWGNSGGPPSHGDGLHELASSSRNSTTVARCLVVSYTTFSPLPLARRSFSSPLTNCRQLLLLSEVERPVPPGLSSRLSFQKRQRQAGAVLSVCKGSANRAKNQIYLSFSEMQPTFDCGQSY